MKLGQILLVAVTLAIAGCAGHVQKVSSGSCGGTPVENYSAVGLCSRHCFIPSDEAVLLTRAAQGDDEAYLLLRAYYWQTGDRAKSLMWTEKAIAAGNPAEQFAQGMEFLDDPERRLHALALLERSASFGLGVAILRLADALESGQRDNDALRLSMIRLAAYNGDIEAIERVIKTLEADPHGVNELVLWRAVLTVRWAQMDVAYGIERPREAPPELAGAQRAEFDAIMATINRNHRAQNPLWRAYAGAWSWYSSDEACARPGRIRIPLPAKERR